MAEQKATTERTIEFLARLAEDQWVSSLTIAEAIGATTKAVATGITRRLLHRVEVQRRPGRADLYRLKR